MSCGSSHGHDEKQQLVQLRERLLVLHKALLESERVCYEQTFGSVKSKQQLLQLVIDDPWFAWLRPLSALVAALDEACEAESPPTAEAAHSFRLQVREMLSPTEEGRGFSRSYHEALQRDPDVVLAHGAVVKFLAG